MIKRFILTVGVIVLPIWVSAAENLPLSNSETSAVLIDEPTGLSLSMEVILEDRRPVSVTYYLKNSSDLQLSVWIPPNEEEFAKALYIVKGQDYIMQRYTHGRAIDGDNGIFRRMSRYLLEPGGVREWSFELAEIVDDREAFLSLDEFSRFYINVNLGFKVALGEKEEAETEVSFPLRWRYSESLQIN